MARSDPLMIDEPQSPSRRDILRRLGAVGASALLPSLASSDAQLAPAGPATPVTVTVTDTPLG